jgi:halimadienyl-diphosphate synthase
MLQPDVARAVATRSRARVEARVADLLAAIAGDEDEQWGGGSISPSAYETAWVALVRSHEHPGALAFPEALTWLLREQRGDGSWGPPFPHALLPTLAAVLALRRCPWQTEPIASAVVRAERYLRRALGRWRAEGVDTPFFEFLVPVLATELERSGLHLPVPDLELMRRRRQEKLERLPLPLLYTGQSNLTHALEALGERVAFGQITARRAAYGGYGYSPSSTAAVLLHGPTWDDAAARWLRHLSERSPGGVPGAIPASHPADTFEAGWALHALLHGGFPLDPRTNPAVHALLEWLACSLTSAGASFARQHAMPCDADDTAMALIALNRLGRLAADWQRTFRLPPAALDPLWTFEREDHFVSYVGERTASTSANAHVLEALTSVEDAARPDLANRRAKLVRYLLDQRVPEGYWLDKWHLSPYYATMSCVLALSRVSDPAVHQAVMPTLRWLRETQRPGGGWGDRRATAEETAYALLACRALLRALPAAAGDGDKDMFRRGRTYLLRRLGGLEDDAALPTLWVDKTLYAPPRVIRAAVLAAVHATGLAHVGR